MATSIKGSLQAILGNETGCYTGKVAALNPMSVKLQGDANMIIGESLLLVPEHLKTRTAKITIDNEEKNITIDDSLSVGDSVIVMSINRGTRYVIIGRC